MSTKMDEDDWAHTLAVFRACLPRRGRKAEDDRRFLEALHFFTVENVRWRALPERFGHWNSVWKRFDRLSKAGVFEAFFDTLASMSSTAHLIQMFDSTIVRAHVSAAGARRASARTFARRLHHENPRKIGRLRRHHRLRSDRRRSFRRASLRNPARHRTRHPASRRHLSTKATPARPTARRQGRAASRRSSRTRPTKKTSRPSSPAPSTRPGPASSRASDGSNGSSASRSAAKRPNETSDQSSASPQASA